MKQTTVIDHFHPRSLLRPLTAAGLMLALCAPAFADMTLDPARSSISLISVKVPADGKSSTSERHSFKQVSGQVDAKGNASVAIPLDSIETGIDIRNERMAEYLFETGTYPDATIEAAVPADALGQGSHRVELDATLSLHGKDKMLRIPALVNVDGQTVVVNSTEPVLIDAADYDLDGGIGKLTELAKLMLIPTTVPVSFTLTFTQSDS